MNLSALTPRQWAYVLHRLDHPDAEPLDHPGNPRKQNLDRIADQLSEQLDRDELRALRDMVSGKRPSGSAYDKEAGRDVDADLVDDATPDEPLDDREAYIARAFRPAPQGETGAKSGTQAADAAWERPADDGAPEAPLGGPDGTRESERTPARDRVRAPGGPPLADWPAWERCT